MGKHNIYLPGHLIYFTQPEKTWLSWIDTGVIYQAGIQVIGSHTSGTPEAHMRFGPLPDPLPSGRLTFELLMFANTAASSYIQYNPRWSSNVDNENNAVVSEGTQTGPNFNGYTALDHVIDTHDLDADAVDAGGYIAMQLDLIGHASWPSVIVTLVPSIYWA